jgi:transposase
VAGHRSSIRCATGSNVVERAVARLKQHRAIATRYDKLAVSYHAWLVMAALLLWLPT